MRSRVSTSRLGALGWALLLSCAPPADVDGPIADAVACERCRIVFDTVLVIGDDEGLGSLPGRGLSVARDSRGRYFVHAGYANELQVFSASGTYLAHVSRPGAGPGELGQLARVLVGPGDTIHVLDNSLSRWTLFSPDLTYVRSVPTSFAIQSAPVLLVPSGELLVAQDLSHDSTRAFPLHVIDRSGASSRSFGPLAVGYRRDLSDVLRRSLAPGVNGEVWAAHRARYRIDLVDPTTGALVRKLEREASWFPPTDLIVSLGASAEEPPRARVFDLMVDAAGLLWTRISVPDARWRSAVVQRDETHIDIVDETRYYDTIIEVLDPEARTLLASARLDDSPGRFLAPACSTAPGRRKMAQCSCCCSRCAWRADDPPCQPELKPSRAVRTSGPRSRQAQSFGLPAPLPSGPCSSCSPPLRPPAASARHDPRSSRTTTAYAAWGHPAAFRPDPLVGAQQQRPNRFEIVHRGCHADRYPQHPAGHVRSRGVASQGTPAVKRPIHAPRHHHAAAWPCPSSTSSSDAERCSTRPTALKNV
jgi:hypothetical protein